MKESKNNVVAVAAAVTRNVGEKCTTNKLKRGWNWEYAFCEKVMPNGTRMTLVVEYQLLHSKYATDVITSDYPGAHQYEDAAIEAIGDAFREFFQAAHEEEVAWKEVRECLYLEAWLIDAPIDSGIVKTFAAALAAINRVSVIITPRKEEEK